MIQTTSINVLCVEEYFDRCTVCAIFNLYICILLLGLHLCAKFRAIGPLFMEILHFKDLGDTSVVRECCLDVNLVIDNLFGVVSDTSPLHKI